MRPRNKNLYRKLEQRETKTIWEDLEFVPIDKKKKRVAASKYSVDF